MMFDSIPVNFKGGVGCALLLNSSQSRGPELRVRQPQSPIQHCTVIEAH